MKPKKFLKWVVSVGTVLLLICGGFSSRAYTLTPVTVEIPVEVRITGDVPDEDAPHTFILEPDGEGEPMPGGGMAAVIMDPDEEPELSTAEVTIEGEGTTAFEEIVFTQAGVYSYTIRQQDNGVEGYTYDQTEYHLEVDVIADQDGNLIANMYARKNASRSKEIEILFINEYEEEEESSEPTEPTEPTEPVTDPTEPTEPTETETEPETTTTEPVTEPETQPAVPEPQPTQPSESTSPNTGDDTNQNLWDILMVLSGSILCIGVIVELVRKKTR
jgi:pilin isopeptide linkage protein